VSRSVAGLASDRVLLAVATAVAVVATAGSLSFSLVLGLVPCELCWYQRILLYPLVVVFGVATLEDRRDVWRTALPLCVGGGAIAAYHSLLQVLPSAGATCGVGGGCTAVLLPMLGGLLTIPRLSLLAFALELVVVAVLARW
jgi:disulfide bond formation protein DsbB